MKRFFLLCLSFIFVSGVNAAEPEDTIKYRKAIMTAIKGHNTALKSILTNKVPYKNQTGHHVAAMEGLFNEIGDLFPEGSDFGETNAKEGIWDNPDRWQKELETSKNAFATFKASGQTAKDLKDFSKATCGSCHKKFKKKQKR